MDIQDLMTIEDIRTEYKRIYIKSWIKLKK
jgi:hypothetical protein